MQAVQATQTPEQQVIARCKEIFALAKTLYNVDMTSLQISFNLRGRAAGWAVMPYKGAPAKDCKVKFNRDMLHRETLDYMLSEVVSHELAHIVCMLRPELGYSHDAGWQSVHISFGGNAERCHEMPVVFGKGLTYEYKSDNDSTVRINERLHARIQGGETITFRRGKGNLHPNSTYYVVGNNGRSLTTPMGPYVGKRAASTGIAPASVGQIAPVLRPAITRPIPSASTTGPKVLFEVGESKASVSRKIMAAWYAAGMSYEAIIAEMQRVNGYDRQLARGTFKANAPKIGLPVQF